MTVFSKFFPSSYNITREARFYLLEMLFGMLDVSFVS